MIGVVGNDLKHFSVLLATTRKKFGVVGNNAEELPQGRTVKHFFVSLSLPLKRRLPKLKPHFNSNTPMPVRKFVKTILPHKIFLICVVGFNGE
jgi:hypothetical protein